MDWTLVGALVEVVGVAADVELLVVGLVEALAWVLVLEEVLLLDQNLVDD